MIQVAPGTKVYLATRPVSMRYGFDGLAAQIAAQLALLVEAIDWRRTVAPLLPTRPEMV